MKLRGSTSRRTTLRSGIFHSPAAGCGAPYRLIEEHRTPTVLSVPIRMCRVRRIFVECQLTGATYDERILETLTDEQLVELLPNAVRASIAAVIVADGVVTAEEQRVAIEVMQDFVPDYDGVDLECDLEDVGITPLDRLLGSLSSSLLVNGKERILACAARVMLADGTPSPETVQAVRSIGAAAGMSAAHIDGVILHSGSLA